MKRAFDPTSDIVFTADLKTLLANETFAPATRKAMRAVSDRAVPSVSLKEAWEGASSAQIALLERGTVLLVLGEVPDIDPEGLTGFDGTWQWKRAKESPAGVLEYSFVPEAGSLFVLADRTWVLGAGTAAQHARAALQASGGHPVGPDRAKIDRTRPVSMLLPENRLRYAEKRVRLLGPIFDGMKQLRLSATLTDAILECDYDKDASAASAEITFKEIVAAFQQNKPQSSSILQDLLSIFRTRAPVPVSFIGQAKLERDGTRIRLKSALPPEILDALATAENGLF